MTAAALLSAALSQHTPAPLEHTPRDGQLQKELYVAVGSWVVVTCDGVADGSLVEWRLNGSVLGHGSPLSVGNASAGGHGTYTCHDAQGGLIRTITLHTGYPPSPPVVHCWSPSYPTKAICSWTVQPEPILPTNYIATYSGGMKSGVWPCLRLHGLPQQCVLEGLDIYPAIPYLLNVTAHNPLGSASTVLPIDLEAIVKPDPPINVRVGAVERRSLLVQWDPPPSWFDPINFALKYKVHYFWNQPDPGQSVTLGPYEAEEAKLRGLVPGRTYHIQVLAQDLLDHGQNSDWSQPVSVTVPYN